MMPAVVFRHRTRFRTARLALTAIGLCLGLAAGGCNRGPEGDSSRLVQRLIEVEPSVRFDPQSAFATEEDALWSFTDPEEVAKWTTEGVESIDVNERRGVLIPEGDPTRRPVMRLVRDVAFSAESVHVLEIVRTGRWHQVSIYWAGPGEGFSEARRIGARRDRNRKNTFVFPVGEVPLWQGDIARLRVDAIPRRDQPMRLVSVAAIRRQAAAASLADVLSQPFKVELGADLRNALLSAPGIPISREIMVGDRQRLRLAFGVPAGTRVPVTFRIRLTAASEEKTLFERTVHPHRRRDLGRWHAQEVDLGEWAGRSVMVHFETLADETLDVGRGLPAWANPEIVGPKAGPSPANGTNRDQRPNVVFISLDTLRADRVSSYGYDKETTPQIDAWARSAGVRFANAVAQAPWTLPSHMSMLTGLDPQRHGVNHSAPAPATIDLLPEMLRRQGYATAAFTGGGYLHPHFGFPQGFDVFRYWPDRIGKHELRDGMARTIDWLKTIGDRRFFLFFHTYETHFPHRRRMPFMAQLDGLDAFRLVDRRFEMRDRGFEGLQWGGNYMVVERAEDPIPVEGLAPDEWALMSDMYDSAVAYADAQIGRLLATLRRLGHGRDTLVVITSDHGEALGEDGLVGHNYLAEHNLLVPLFIGFPDGRGRGRAIQEQVRSIDIVPTVLDYLGIPPSSRLDGVSLLPLIEGDASEHPDEAWSYASSANGGLSVRIKNRLKYRYNNGAWADLNGVESLYDLRRDPHEKTDLAVGHPQTEALRRQTRLRLNPMHSGLQLEVRNHTKGVVRGRLYGDGLQHARVKFGIPACRCLFWKPWPVIRVPSKRGVSIQFEGPMAPTLRIAGALQMPSGREVPFDHQFDMANMGRYQTFGFDGRKWKPMKEFGRAQIRFSLVRSTTITVPPPASPDRNRELEEQLKALGYVN